MIKTRKNIGESKSVLRIFMKLYLIMLMIMSDIFLKCPELETFQRKRATLAYRAVCSVHCLVSPAHRPLQSVPLPALAVPGLVAHLPRHSGRHLHGGDDRCKM